MRKGRTSANSKPPSASAQRAASPAEAEQLRQRLAEVEAELSLYRSKHQWLQSALETQRHARQMLEAGVSADYGDTVERIRQVVDTVVPAKVTLVVISKGDEQLIQFEGRQAWHFPQTEEGVYAGYHPADSTEAICQLKKLIDKGGQFLLIPNTSFWWLEHYRDLKRWLEQSHNRIWRDERCAIYKLTDELPDDGMLLQVSAPKEVESSASRPGPARLATTDATGPQPRSVQQASDILCFPIIDWDFRFQRPQQLMLRFAAAGHQVFYLSHKFRKSGPPYCLRQLASSLWEVSLRGPGYNIHEGVLDQGFCDTLFSALSDLSRDLSFESQVAMVQSPFWWSLARQVVASSDWKLVYDCMDHHAGFSTSNPLLVELERELFLHADLVVTSSEFLQAQARLHARNVVLVRNGCDYYHFARAGAKPEGGRPVIGYYGAIADWFDSHLVAELAQRRPEWDFVLVGSTLSGDISRLSQLPNVTLPGEVPYLEIPDWLAKFDLAILPFKRNALTEAANPVKAYEIFATGKPLVSVPLPEMVPLAPLVRLASTVDEFEREIQFELSGADPNLRRKRRAFARSNTWEERYQRFYAAIQNLNAKRYVPLPSKNQAQVSVSFV